MKENNNKGFTLIEILVAVIALALVVMPLLQGFVSTANLNKKARERMEATNVAQSIMERHSTATIQEIKTQAESAGYTFVEDSANHKYGYTIPTYTHNGKDYTVKISLDASEYHPGGGVKTYNSDEYALITSVDTAQDGIYAESDRVFQDALKEFVDRNRSANTISDKTITKEQFETQLERTIRVMIEQKTEIGSTDEYTEVNITYTYKAPSGWVDDSDREYSKSLNIFTNQNLTPAERTAKPLRNIYVLFKPYYGKHYSFGFADRIEIVNMDELDCNFYLIKTITGDASDLSANENSYSASVNVYEGNIDFADPAFVANAKVFTNLGYNMANDNVTPTQVKYYYIPPSNVATEAYIEHDYFVPGYTEERMYKMKVEVYPAGGTEKLAELSN